MSVLKAIFNFFGYGKKKKKKNKTNEKNADMFTEKDAIEALQKIRDKYGKETAQLIEKIMRLETNHFKSRQYKYTGSAGMEAGKWANLPADIKTLDFVDNHTGKTRPFVVWDSPYDFMEYLIAYFKRHGYNWARWNTTDPQGQLAYKHKVLSIRNQTIV